MFSCQKRTFQFPQIISSPSSRMDTRVRVASKIELLMRESDFLKHLWNFLGRGGVPRRIAPLFLIMAQLWKLVDGSQISKPYCTRVEIIGFAWSMTTQSGSWIARY